MNMPFEDLLAVGYIRRAHGLKGEVVVHLTTNRIERVSVGAVLMTLDHALIIRTSRPKDADHLVTFEGVTGREAADQLRGLELRAVPLDDPDELWVHDLVGLQVTDQSGVVRGSVLEVQANPASDLLVLDGGALIPMVFVTSIDGDQIHVEVPDGLFDL